MIINAINSFTEFLKTSFPEMKVFNQWPGPSQKVTFPHIVIINVRNDLQRFTQRFEEKINNYFNVVTIQRFINVTTRSANLTFDENGAFHSGGLAPLRGLNLSLSGVFDLSNSNLTSFTLPIVRDQQIWFDRLPSTGIYVHVWKSSSPVSDSNSIIYNIPKSDLSIDEAMFVSSANISPLFRSEELTEDFDMIRVSTTNPLTLVPAPSTTVYTTGQWEMNVDLHYFSKGGDNLRDQSLFLDRITNFFDVQIVDDQRVSSNLFVSFGQKSYEKINVSFLGFNFNADGVSLQSGERRIICSLLLDIPQIVTTTSIPIARDIRSDIEVKE